MEWFDVMGQKGMYSPATAKNCVGAVKRLQTVYGDDEDSNPLISDFNVDEVVDRFARLNPGNSRTIRTYKTRAELLVREYQRFLDDPGGFTPQATRSRPKSEGDTEAKPRKRRKKEKPEPAQQVQPATPRKAMREYPLDDDRVFEFLLPDGGISVDDLRRIMFHLATLAVDFDPIAGLRPLLEGKSS